MQNNLIKATVQENVHWKLWQWRMSYSFVSRFTRNILLFSLTLCLFLNNAVAYAVPLSEPATYLLPKCEEISEAQLRTDLTRIIQEFTNSQTDINFGEIVNQQWRTLNLDSVIDSEIDNAVLQVGDVTGLGGRFRSSWVPSKAQKLAEEVTQIAFNSPSLKSKLNQLSNDIAEQLGSRLELASAQSSSYAIECLQQFVNRQYSQTFVNIFSRKIQALELDPNLLNSFQPSTLQYISKHKFGIAGGALLTALVTGQIRKRVVNTVVDRVFQQVAGRLLGRIGTGVIPVVGEVVAALLIGKDVVDSFDGALPEIQRALKEAEVKQEIRSQITTLVEENIRSETNLIAREVSNEVYAEWLDFQKDYQSALSLAGELPEFKEILSQTSDLSKISLLVGVALNNMGRSQLVEAIKDRTFEQALALPDVSYKILETTHDLTSLVAWTRLAANQIDDVVRLELYKHLSPKDLDRQLLIELLSLKDPSVISRVSLLDVHSIRSLLSLSRQNLVALSAQLSPDNLQRLAGYLDNLKQPQVNLLIKFLLNDDPAIIKNSNVMAHIIQSHNIASAIEFWEAEEDLLSVFSGIYGYFAGSISWRLIADKFGLPVFLLSATLPILLLTSLTSFVGIWIYRKLPKMESLGESNAD